MNNKDGLLDRLEYQPWKTVKISQPNTAKQQENGPIVHFDMCIQDRSY